MPVKGRRPWETGLRYVCSLRQRALADGQSRFYFSPWAGPNAQATQTFGCRYVVERWATPLRVLRAG
jgi:hypothetical protein